MSAQRPVQPPILEPDLLRVLGHELRSPLASLLGYAELMRDDDEAADPHAVGRFVEVVVRNSQRQLDLVEDVLLAVALDTGALQPVAESCSPMRALSVCLAGLPVELHVSPLDLVDAPAVLADPALLTRCLGLLVRRAVACGSGAEITWDWSVDGDMLRLRLHRSADVGADHDAFLRPTPRGAVDGCDPVGSTSGTGLEGVLGQRLAELMGGSLWLDQGASRLTVDLRLPADPV